MTSLVRTFALIGLVGVVADAGHVGLQIGQFMNLHNIAIDSKGNIYTAEGQGKNEPNDRDVPHVSNEPNDQSDFKYSSSARFWSAGRVVP